MASVAIGSDHAGYPLKQAIIDHLRSRGYDVEDMGCHGRECVDYPDYAAAVAGAVQDGTTLGVLICATGIGMSVAANKLTGVRAALCHTEYEAQMARNQVNANIVCVGARTMSRDAAIRTVVRFMRSEYEGYRHDRRLEKIDRLAS